MTAGSLAGAAREGDRAALARLLSVVESGGEEARAAVAAVHGASRGAAIVGITGAPGSGPRPLRPVSRDAASRRIGSSMAGVR